MTTDSATKFKYAVQITKDGKDINSPVAADFAEVTTVDATAATKINKLGLVSNNEAWENPTVTKGDQVQIAAVEYENALGDKNTDVDEEGNPTELNITAPEVKTAVSSNPTVAYYDEKTGVIVRNKDGKVTFTVTFKGEAFKDQKYTIDVNVKAKQTATSIEKVEDLKVKANEPQALDITVLDQDGEEMRNEEGQKVFITTTLAGEKEAEKATVSPEEGVAFKAGKHVVNVYADADKKVKLGSFNVEAVDVEGLPTDYTLEVAKVDDKTPQLDINADPKKATKTLTLDIKAFIDGVAVELPGEDAKNFDLVVETSEDKKEDAEKVLKAALNEDDPSKIDVTANKAGKATVKLFTKEGDMKTEVASIELEVKNTTAKVTDLTLKKDQKVLVGKLTEKDNQKELATAVVEAVTQEITADYIESVELVPANKQVIVTLKDVYGGLEKVLDAEFDIANLNTAVVETTKQGVVEVKKATADISVADLVKGTEIVIGDKTHAMTLDLATAATELNTEDGVTVTVNEEGNLTLTGPADGTNFTYTVGEKEVTTANGVEADEDETAATAATAEILVADLEKGTEIKIGADESAKTHEMTLDLAAAATELSDTEGVTVVANTEEGKLTLTGPADGTNFTYKVGETEVTTDNGVEANEGTDVTTVTFTFSEAVELDGDFSFFVKGTEAEEGTKATEIKVDKENVEVSKDNKKSVVVTLTENQTVEAQSIITDIKGLKAVKGIVLVKDVTVTAAESETTTP